MSRSSSNRQERDPSKSRSESRLSVVDKLWIALAIAIFVIAFVIILIYGVF